MVLLASYKPYTQSAESIISILVTLGLLWLQLSDNLSLNRLKKGQISQNMNFFNVSEFVNLVIYC